VEATGFSKALINFYKTTQHHFPEDSNINYNHYGNLKPHSFTVVKGTSYMTFRREIFNASLVVWLQLLIKVFVRGTETSKNVFEIREDKGEFERWKYDVTVCVILYFTLLVSSSYQALWMSGTKKTSFGAERWWKV